MLTNVKYTGYMVFNKRATRSRDGNELNTHPQTKRTYVLRSMVFHGVRPADVRQQAPRLVLHVQPEVEQPARTTESC